VGFLGVAGEQEESIKEDAVQLNRSASSLVISTG
jgi:hypothetical protein